MIVSAVPVTIVLSPDRDVCAGVGVHVTSVPPTRDNRRGRGSVCRGCECCSWRSACRRPQDLVQQCRPRSGSLSITGVATPGLLTPSRTLSLIVTFPVGWFEASTPVASPTVGSRPPALFSRSCRRRRGCVAGPASTAVMLPVGLVRPPAGLSPVCWPACCRSGRQPVW